MFEILQKLLDEKKMSVNKLAKTIGINQSSLSDWKRGVSKPKIDKLKKIADYFNVSIEIFIEN